MQTCHKECELNRIIYSVQLISCLRGGAGSGDRGGPGGAVFIHPQGP